MTPLMFLAEARGETEARYSSTLIGASGAELLRQLHEAQVITMSAADDNLMSRYYATKDGKFLMALWDHHPHVHRTNVFNLHPPNNDLNHLLGPKATAIPGTGPLKVTRTKRSPQNGGNFVQAQHAPELERLGDEILAHNPNLIVCLGNCALWALAGVTGVGKLRGTILSSSHCVSGYKLLPTYHPANILRNYESRPLVIADLCKAAHESQFPDIRRPEREIWIEPTLADIQTFFSTHCTPDRLLSVDIETAADRITCIGFAPTPYIALVIPFDDPRQPDHNYWRTPGEEAQAWRMIKGILEDPTIRKLGQNFLYDIAFLWRSMKIRVVNAVDDTMLLHHALQPEALKNLGFLGSIYSTENFAWKGMRTSKITKRED